MKSYHINSAPKANPAQTVEHWLNIGKAIWRDLASVKKEIARLSVALRLNRTNKLVTNAKMEALLILKKQHDKTRNVPKVSTNANGSRTRKQTQIKPSDSRKKAARTRNRSKKTGQKT